MYIVSFTPSAVDVHVESTKYKDVDIKYTHSGDVMDGYVTQLKKLKKANNDKITWLLDGEKLEDATLLAQIDKAVSEVKPLYRKKTMFIHADPGSGDTLQQGIP